MKQVDKKLSGSEVAAARTRRLEAQALQAVESNPLDAEQIAMFEMFERENWPHARRLAYILARAAGKPEPAAAQ